jgi:hypothetical protein
MGQYNSAGRCTVTGDSGSIPGMDFSVRHKVQTNLGLQPLTNNHSYPAGVEVKVPPLPIRVYNVMFIKYKYNITFTTKLLIWHQQLTIVNTVQKAYCK